MMFSQIRRSTAIFVLSLSVSAVPALAQSSDNKNTDNAGLPPPSSGKVVEDIVARINDQIITESDYNRAAEQLDAEARQQGVPAAEVEQKKADLLRDLIDQQLLLSKGKELGITGETELIKQLDDIRKQNHLDSMEDLEKAAQQQGVSYEDFKASIRNKIITQQVVRDEVGRKISMTPAEVQQYFKAHESQFAQPESVTLNEILVPTPAKAASEGPDAADVEAAQAKADAISAKLAAGAKFEDQAKPSPADPSDPKYVALGQFRRGQLAKEIEDKTFALNSGQYTQPIRTKQGYIILQVTEHNRGGDASFKQVEPQVEEAIFYERMQPKLREYLTQLREEAAIDIKPGMIDTGASPNEMHLSYSAYTPPPEKKKKKFARTRFRGRTKSAATQTAKAAAPAGSQTPAASPATAATTTAQTAPATNTQQASNNTDAFQKPGKREKIRFGQAPRESLPPAQVASTGDNSPAVTTPDTHYINPDGTVSGTTPAQPERKTRLANRPTVHKAKKTNPADSSDQATPDEQASQKVQNSGLGLTDPNAPPKPKEKQEKTRLANRKSEPEQVQQPYLGKPEPNQPSTPSGGQQTAPASGQPAPSSAPAAGPPGTTQP